LVRESDGDYEAGGDGEAGEIDWAGEDNESYELLGKTRLEGLMELG